MTILTGSNGGTTRGMYAPIFRLLIGEYYCNSPLFNRLQIKQECLKDEERFKRNVESQHVNYNTFQCCKLQLSVQLVLCFGLDFLNLKCHQDFGYQLFLCSMFHALNTILALGGQYVRGQCWDWNHVNKICLMRNIYIGV